MGKARKIMSIQHYAPAVLACNNDYCENEDDMVDEFENKLHAQSEGWSRMSEDGETMWICPGCSVKIKKKKGKK